MKIYASIATLAICTSFASSDIEIEGTAQAIASRSGGEDRQTLDLSTTGVASGTLNAVFQEATATLTVSLDSVSSISSVHVVHTLDSGDIPVGGSSSDGFFTFTVPADTVFEFTGLLEQQSTDPSGGGTVKIRNANTFVTWFQAGPNFALPNNPIDFSMILSSGTLDAGTYELTWFHAANRTSSNAQTLASADFTLTLTTPSCSPADLTNDGVLDFFDVSVFLTAFGSMDTIADLTNDGVWDFFDVSAFLSAFAAGCP